MQDNDGSSSEEEEADEEDVDVALKKEVAQLQAAGVKQERRFQALDSGANNVIFIKTQSLGTYFNLSIVGVIYFLLILLLWLKLVCFCFVFPFLRIRQTGSSHPVRSPHHQEEEVQSDPSDAASEKLKRLLCLI